MRKADLIFLMLLTVLGNVKNGFSYSDDVAIHGFGGWAYGKTDNENRYLVGDEDGNYDNLNFSLNVNGSPYDNLRLQFQTSFAEEFDKRKVSLDYAFAEWDFSERITFRIGKIKTPFMLYTEIYDVGTLRPFFTLPQGVYHHLSAESYKGVGFTGNILSGKGWEILYDLYGGKINIHSVRGLYSAPDGTAVSDSIPRFIYFDWYADNMIGSRLTINTPIDGLCVMFSSYSGDIKYKVDGSVMEVGDERIGFGGVSLEYLTDRFWGRAEFLNNEAGEIQFDTGYLELAYKFGEHWQIAFRSEYEDIQDRVDLEDDAEDLENHEEVALGVNYWFNSNFVLKFSLHQINGNDGAMPDEVGDIINSDFEDETGLILIGTQFSF